MTTRNARPDYATPISRWAPHYRNNPRSAPQGVTYDKPTEQRAMRMLGWPRRNDFDDTPPDHILHGSYKLEGSGHAIDSGIWTPLKSRVGTVYSPFLQAWHMIEYAVDFPSEYGYMLQGITMTVRPDWLGKDVQYSIVYRPSAKHIKIVAYHTSGPVLPVQDRWWQERDKNKKPSQQQLLGRNEHTGQRTSYASAGARFREAYGD